VVYHGGYSPVYHGGYSPVYLRVLYVPVYLRVLYVPVYPRVLVGRRVYLRVLVGGGYTTVGHARVYHCWSCTGIPLFYTFSQDMGLLEGLSLPYSHLYS